MATTEKKQTATRASGARAAKAAGTTKAAAPKTVRAKAPAAAKAAPAVNLVFQYQGREISQAGMVEAVMNAWTGAGGTPAEVKSLDLYVKPEDGAVYYVVNGTESGKFEF